ncbi:hypothetical protein DW204_15140 [Phocaeicola plebeius]|uniref:Transposase n=1 Tax=Phocaeicola plebeius TaxID=310297 RepID=A0A414WNX7_9BACT|nr:hypothetical protein DW204_15140 [Phocaeicola plebeius]
MFMSRNRKVVKILHYERGFYVLYEKRPVMGRFKKPVFDEVSKCYRIQWSSLDPSDASNVYMFMSRNRKVVKILHYERGFYVLYEKRPVMGKFKKPVFDEVSKCYRIQWSDMAYLTESIVVDKMYVSPKD